MVDMTWHNLGLKKEDVYRKTTIVEVMGRWCTSLLKVNLKIKPLEMFFVLLVTSVDIVHVGVVV